MNATTLIPSPRTRWNEDRTRALFARVRHRQLQTALAGDMHASARYADRARRVRRSACEADRD